MRSLMFFAAVVVAGTGLAARYLHHGEAHADAVNRRVRTQEVQSISIDTPNSPRHERRLPIAELRSLLGTQPGALLDEQTLATDRAALEANLVARGYLSATVTEPQVTFSRSGGAYVVFDVDRGPMFLLRNITVTGPGAKEADIVTLSSGDEAVRSRIDRAKQSLADATKRDVDVIVHEDEKTSSLDIELATH